MQSFKELYNQVIPKLPYIIITGFCLYWIRGIFEGKYEPKIDNNSLYLFLIPAFLSWYISNIFANIHQGRFIFALPKFFKYKTRRIFRILLMRLQAITFISLCAILMLNQFVLIPQIESKQDELLLGPHVKVFYGWFGVSDILSAKNFALSKYWGYFLVILVIYAIYVLYRYYIDGKAKEKLYKIYRELAFTATFMRKNNDYKLNYEDGKTCLSTIIEYVNEAATLGIFTKLLPKVTKGVYCGFLLIPDPEKPKNQFINAACYCSKNTWRHKIDILAKQHKPRKLDITKLINLWNSCFSDVHGDKKFSEKCFQEKKEDYISATGMAFEIERPKIFNFVWNCLALSNRYRDILRDNIVNEDIEIYKALKFRSYLILPLKIQATVAGVIFIGSTRPFSFKGSILPILESYSHAIAELVCTLSNMELIKTPDNIQVEVNKHAKPYYHIEERKIIRDNLRNINRMLRKGEKHAKPICLQQASEECEEGLS
ncbi:MAG: hypothetical protein ACOYVF_06455 [Candidatus Zixiibacteriota bacterium]